MYVASNGLDSAVSIEINEQLVMMPGTSTYNAKLFLFRHRKRIIRIRTLHTKERTGCIGSTKALSVSREYIEVDTSTTSFTKSKQLFCTYTG